MILSRNMEETYLSGKCPLTGQKIKTDKKWTYKNDACAFSLGILQERIIISITSGRFKINDVIAYFSTLDLIIDEYKNNENNFIVLNDYSKLKYASVKGRNFYLNYYKTNQDKFDGLIYYSVSSMFKLNISVTK